MIKKILIGLVITVFIGIAAFGIVNVTSAQSSEKQITDTIAEPVLHREEAQLEFQNANQECSGTGVCDPIATQAQTRTRLQDESSETCSNDGTCTGEKLQQGFGQDNMNGTQSRQQLNLTEGDCTGDAFQQRQNMNGQSNGQSGN